MHQVWVRVLSLGLFLFAGVASGAALDALDTESADYANKLVPLDETTLAPDDAAQLLKSADIMSRNKACETALALRKSAIALGATTDFEMWMNIAKDAACVKRWKESSHAGWLAARASDDPALQIHAWALVGSTLERRDSWRHDWKPAALEAYELVLDVTPVDWINERVAALKEGIAAENRLLLENAETAEDRAGAKLCLRFNEYLPSPSEFHYQDYIRIKPAVEGSYTVDGYDLCISGAAFATRYDVTVLKGLTVGERELAEDEQLTLETGHSPAAAWFGQSAYVLPKSAQRAVPLYSINTAQASLRILRIDERNILTPFVQQRFQRALDDWDIEQIEQTYGEQVWQADVALSTASDEIVVNKIELPALVTEQPGLYVLTTAGDDGDYDSDNSSQWIVVSDIGLTSYRGADGLTVIARSLRTGQTLEGVETVLYARNNQALSRMTTDNRGLARFSPGLLQGSGGRQAVQVSASSADLGLSFLSLTHPGLDLSDRGVDGRAPGGALDAFVYTERGVYRPGESVNVVALLRDTRGRAVSGLPLTMRLVTPSGDPVMENVVKPQAAGSYVTTLPLAAGARTGRWTVEWYADIEAAPVGSISFLVEAIMPPRMEATLTVDGVLSAGHTLLASVQANYLFGAPAADRPVMSELTIEADPQPFAEYADYRFGNADVAVLAEAVELQEVTTNSEGTASVAVELEQVPASRQPLRGRLRAEVMDVDGRIVAAQSMINIRHLPLYLGIRPLFDDSRVELNGEAGFDLVALDPAGKRVPRDDVEWRLVSVEHNYQWFRKDGEWGYEPVRHERTVSSGKLGIDGAAPAKLALRTTQGDYRLEVYNTQTGVISSFPFQAGEQVHSTADTPDAVKLGIDRERYIAGQIARLQIESPYSGPASLVMAGERVYSISYLELKDGKAELDVTVDGDWGAGAYALVTVYRPGDADRRGAGRAVGLVWLDIDPVERRLVVDIDSAAEVQPRQEITVPVRIDGYSPGERINLTLAAVDDGVLQLTSYSAPDPLEYYFSKRRLGTEIRDLYGRLIRMPDERPEQLRTGAGSSGLRGAPAGNIRIVSRFSGVVEVGDDGIARVPLNLPNFNGRLRLMAVAWSQGKLGSSERTMLVRDPVVVAASLPRFMTQGDQSTIGVLLDNQGGNPGRYSLTLSSDSDVVAVTGDTRTFELARGEHQFHSFRVDAHALGSGQLKLLLEGPVGYRYEDQLNIGVRGRYLPVIDRRYSKLEPGAALALDRQLMAGLLPDTVNVNATFSNSPGMDVPGLLSELERYPYGCLEQLTSKSLPLLYAGELSSRWGLKDAGSLRPGVQRGIQSILDKQHADGGFGLWSERSDVSPWASLYALEFLLRARDAGYQVPDFFIDRALNWIDGEVLYDTTSDTLELADQAYAHYVLVLAGRARPEDLRYLFDTRLEEMPTPLSAAQLGAALAGLGESERARKAFQRAMAMPQRELQWQDYGSSLRDMAAIVSLLDEAGPSYGDPARLMNELVLKQQQRKWLSTQEEAWLIMAARTLEKGTPLNLTIDGAVDATGQDVVALDLAAEQLIRGQTISNTGTTAAWTVTSVEGTPDKMPARDDNQFRLQRHVYTLDGEAADVGKLSQGQLMLVVLQGEALSGDSHPALVVDLLPAGFEVENPRLANGLDLEQFHWLPELTDTQYIDLLDDRFVAALDIEERRGEQKQQAFTLAYLVRVVVPGSYFWPPAEVEDMYRPYLRARTTSAQVEIAQ